MSQNLACRQTEKEADIPTLYGKVYVNARDGLGIASYHFITHGVRHFMQEVSF